MDMLTLHASYSYDDHSFRNVGAGLSLQTNRWQLYAAADNLLAVRPLNTRSVNLRVGINLFFGCATPAEERSYQRPAQGAGCFWIKRRRANEKLLPDD
jgi:hypothetical protein